MENMYVYETSEGKIAISEDSVGITALWLYEKKEINIDEYNLEETPLLKEANAQLQKYLKGELKAFDLPISLKGTDFQKKVWTELIKIPYGQTKSYKDIAESVGSPKAFRAVGMSNNKNKIPIIIPCHRVIGNNGKLVGYALGLDMKERLIHMEKNCSC